MHDFSFQVDQLFSLLAPLFISSASSVFSVAALLLRAAGAEFLFDLLGYQSGPFGS